jgi:hypothetical protein
MIACIIDKATRRSAVGIIISSLDIDYLHYRQNSALASHSLNNLESVYDGGKGDLAFWHGQMCNKLLPGDGNSGDTSGITMENISPALFSG